MTLDLSNPWLHGLVFGAVLVSVLMALVAFITWFERKLAGRIQSRLGPTMVGPFGLLQPIADAVKAMQKEFIVPKNADRFLFWLAPPLTIAFALATAAVIPFSKDVLAANLDVGVLYALAFSGLLAFPTWIAGWASNNKYALLGAFRVVALLISYEVPLALALIVPVMLANSMSMVGITEAQWGMWFVFMAPIAAFLFFIGSQAETGRAPFDLIEAESELTAGFNTEYSGMKFAMFFAGEFMHVFTNGVLMAVLFTGGWIGPFVGELPLIGLVWLMAKASVWYIIALWVRNTLPRLRIDQVMLFNWQFLVPLSIVNLLVTAFLLQVIKMAGLTPADPGNFVQNIPQTLVLLVGNLVEFGGVLIMLRNRGRRERIADAAKGLSAPVHAVGD